MNLRLLEILACPDCKADLALESGLDPDATIIENGTLRCLGCGRLFFISGGIPRLLPRDDAASSAQSFELEFASRTGTDEDLGEDALNEFLLYSRTGWDPGALHALGDLYPTHVPESYVADGSALSGRVVLDAGCGPGRFLRLIARHAKLVVGLELGAHVERARRRCADLENVEVVQGSVLRPPFRVGSFDFVCSIGVLHHTPDPREGCARLAALLQPGGQLSVWVYPPGYWGGRFRGPANRLLHRSLQTVPTRLATWICVTVLFRLGQLQRLAATSGVTKIALAPLFLISVPRHPNSEVMKTTIVDYFLPSIISTHSKDEVTSWLERAGLEDVRHLPVPSSATGRRDPPRE